MRLRLVGGVERLLQGRGEGEKLSGLIDTFSVVDRTSPSALRAALREAAPHAFKELTVDCLAGLEPSV